MISKLDNNFSLLEASFKALSQRQEILSSNVANESTPNYKAQDFDFKRAISDVVSTSEMAKQSAVIAGKPHLPSYVFFRNNVAGVDGNNVRVDEERRELAENSLRYEAAVTSAQIDIKNLLNVLQG